MLEQLDDGGAIARDGPYITEIRDQAGATGWRAWWDDDALTRLVVWTPRRLRVTVHARAATHPTLGPCDVVEVGGREAARFTSVAWDRPRRLPALVAPASLPRGAGTAILSFLARCADRPLRYVGPRPSGALFDSLLEAFEVHAAGGLTAAHRRFVGPDTVDDSAIREAPVDFHPAPFDRWWQGRVCVQRRHGVERVFVDGVGFSRMRAGARRVRPHDDGWVAVMELGGHPWHAFVTVDLEGRVLGPVRPLPPLEHPAVGRPLPERIRLALADALPLRAPAVLRDAVEAVLREAPLHFGDPGPAEAAVRDGAIVVHAALPEALARHGPPAVLDGLARAVEEPARLLALRRIATPARRRR